MTDREVLEKTRELIRIGKEAVRVAQEESRAMGVPNVYSINGVLHWELPDGSLTTDDPTEKPAADSGDRASPGEV